MAERIRGASRALPRVTNSSATLARLDGDQIAEALGAESTGIEAPHGATPVSYFGLRERLFAELVSTGGRPGRRDAVRRRKIPVTEEEWARLRQIADVMGSSGLNAAPGQIASILLRQRLEQLDAEVAARSDSTDRSRAAELEERVDRVMRAAASAAGVPVPALRPVARDLIRKMLSGRPDPSLEAEA